MELEDSKLMQELSQLEEEKQGISASFDRLQEESDELDRLEEEYFFPSLFFFFSSLSLNEN